MASGGELCLHLLRKFLSSKVLGIFSIGSFLIESCVLSQRDGAPLESSPSVLMMHGPLSSFFSSRPSFDLFSGQDDPSVPVDWGRFTASNLSLYSSHLDLQFIEYPDCDNDLHEDQVGALLSLTLTRVHPMIAPHVAGLDGGSDQLSSPP
jgi:hypothetical protein